MSIPMMASTAAKAASCGGFQPATQRNYPAVSGAAPSLGTIVPVLEADDIQLAPNGWMRLPTVGATSARPALNSYALTPGCMHVDTTVSKTVIWDGGNWRDVTTGTIA